MLKSLMMDDFDVEKLLPGDVQAISMYLYSTAYGDKVELEVTCPSCSYTEKKDVHISSFKMKEINVWPNEKRVIQGELPVSKHSFTMRIPTFFDEFRFKRSMENQDTHLDRISFLVSEVNGVTGQSMVRQYIGTLPIRDSRHLRKFIEDSTPGVDTHVEHVCADCHQEFKVHVSSGHNFLRLPSSYAASMLEEVYLVAKHGENIGWEEAIRMSTIKRKWVLTRIQQDNKRKGEQEAKEANRMQSKGRRFSKR